MKVLTKVSVEITSLFWIIGNKCKRLPKVQVHYTTANKKSKSKDASVAAMRTGQKIFRNVFTNMGTRES